MSTRGNQDAAIDLLCEQPDRLEPGLIVLEPRLPLGENVVVDVLARDTLGYAVVVLFSGGDVARDLARMASVMAALQGGRFLLGRLYAGKGLDPAQRPRFVLMASRFPDHAPALLDMMAQVEIQAVEYRVVKSSVGRSVLDLQTFHRTSGPVVGWTRAPVPAAPAPAPAMPKAPLPELELIEDAGYPQRAREAIRALSSRVKETQSGDRHLYHVEDHLLATLRVDGRGFHVQVGGKPDALVTDEESYNRQLDAVFDLFFRELSVDRVE